MGIHSFFKACIIVFLFLGALSCSEKQNISFSDKVNVSLREVGHHLLLANQDSTTPIKPALALSTSEYQLAFEKQLNIYPDSLVIYLENSFKKVAISEDHLIEVVECLNGEVVYSYYQKEQKTDNSDIHCSQRQLKTGCYLINVSFLKAPTTQASSSRILSLLFLGVITVLILIFTYSKIKPKSVLKKNSDSYESIGRYKFYPEQNKLATEGSEIGLSTKECELLSLFIAKPNHIIKRDELTKKVWEDNGVIVGRSLDTYISKLRKKLKEDPAIKLTNIHGVGYKLEL